MNKSELFKRAWHIARTTGKTFSICLVKAWELYKLKKAMAIRKVKFAFEKKDGTLRYATGTLEKDYLQDVKGRGSSLSVMTYWDIESRGFRCFKIENLIKIY
jgi:hypothetical protein